MKKLCFIVNNFDVGGLEKVVISLINHIDRSKFDIHVICLSGPGELFDQIDIEETKILVLSKKGGMDFQTIFLIRKFLLASEIEIVHAHNFGPLIYAGLAAKLIFMNRPEVIYSEHNQIYRQIKAGLLKTKFYISLADKVLTVSNKLKQFYQDELNIVSRVETLYNGIQGVAANEVAVKRNDFSLTDDDFIFGTAVVLSEQKGLIYLLEAAIKLLDSGKPIKIIIAGDGPLKGSLEQYSQEHGLSGIVQFIGYRSDVHNLIKMYDVYILPSLWEGLPLALLEAMSAGKPIVATDVGGNAEIVEDGVNGLIVNSKSSSELYDAMIEMYQNRENLVMYNKVNKDKFDMLFSLDSMISNHEKLYSAHTKLE